MCTCVNSCTYRAAGQAVSCTRKGYWGCWVGGCSPHGPCTGSPPWLAAASSGSGAAGSSPRPISCLPCLAATVGYPTAPQRMPGLEEAGARGTRTETLVPLCSGWWGAASLSSTAHGISLAQAKPFPPCPRESLPPTPSKHQFCAPQFPSEHHFCVLSGVHVLCECLGGLGVWCWGGHPSWPVCPESWGRQRPHDPTSQYSSLSPLPSQNRVPQVTPMLLYLEGLPGTKGFHFVLVSVQCLHPFFYWLLLPGQAGARPCSPTEVPLALCPSPDCPVWHVIELTNSAPVAQCHRCLCVCPAHGGGSHGCMTVRCFALF